LSSQKWREAFYICAKNFSLTNCSLESNAKAISTKAGQGIYKNLRGKILTLEKLKDYVMTVHRNWNGLENIKVSSESTFEENITGIYVNGDNNKLKKFRVEGIRQRLKFIWLLLPAKFCELL
jgi:hypothetical protein